MSSCGRIDRIVHAGIGRKTVEEKSLLGTARCPKQAILAHCSTKLALVKAYYSEVSHDDIFWVYIARSPMEKMARCDSECNRGFNSADQIVGAKTGRTSQPY